MSNPPSTRRPPAIDAAPSTTATPRRRWIARALPAGTALIACVLLATAAAADGRAAALILAVWVAALVVVGMRLSAPSREPVAPPAPIVRRPVLVLSKLSQDGSLGATQTLPVVASPAAIAVLDSRPCG